MTGAELYAQALLLPGYLGAHLQLALLALLLGVVVSVPLGIVAARHPRLGRVVLGTVSVFQTIPSLALLAFLVPMLSLLGLRSIGMLPALIGLFVYSLLPILRNTVTGIASIDPAYPEAARGVGMTDLQRLWRVELPLATPAIIAGIRTSAVWTVGTATLATPVGAVSLGNYIFGGLQTRNYAAVLFGCVSSAALALLLDGLIHLVEQSLATRSRIKGWLAAVGLCLVAMAALAPAVVGAFRSTAASRPVLIGAKTFTEQYILSRILAGHIARSTGDSTQVLDSLGSSVAFDALARSELDAYVDYTGTLWTAVLKRTDIPQSRQVLLAEVKKELAQRYGIEVLAPLGFENAYTLAMRRSDAERLAVHSLSDLSKHSAELQLGCDYEFLQRPEWTSVQKSYGLRFASLRSMDPSLLYEAARLQAVDVIVAFSSDGRIASYDLVALADDKSTLLPYDAVILVRRGLRSERPQVASALLQLQGAVDLDRMQHLNAAVDKQRQTPDQVATQFLREWPAGTTQATPVAR